MIQSVKRSFTRMPPAMLSLLLAASTSADTGTPPTAVDDYVLLALGTDTVTVDMEDLTANDHHAKAATVTIERTPIHGDLFEISGGLKFRPNDDFWAIGSDLLVYRLETPEGSSNATLYFVDRKRSYSHVADFGFEDSSELPSQATAGVSIETSHALAGAGSLAVRVTDPTTDEYGTVVLPDNPHQAGPANTGEVDACAGGFASIIPSEGAEPDDPAGYLLLLGGEQADIHSAAVRVGVTHSGSDLFVEVRDTGTTSTWHRSAILDRGNEVVRFDVAFAGQDGSLNALLRADGLAVRTPSVSFETALPTHAHLGFFQPAGGGSTADLLYDLVHVGTAPNIELPLADTGRLLVTDNFESGALGVWGATHGSGLVTSAASALSGDLGLGISDLPNGKSYVSFQTRAHGESSDPRFRRLTARSTVDLASLELDPGYPLAPLAIQSGDDPIFGDPAFRALVVGGISGPQLKLFAYHDGGWSTSGLTPVADESVLELQAGRADAPGLANGWARLWIDGDIALELYRLDNFERELRNIHFGAEGYPSSRASGTLRLDDATITR